MVATATQWFGTARVPRSLTRAGFDVSLLAPGDTQAEKSRYVARTRHLPDNATLRQWVDAFAETAPAGTPPEIVERLNRELVRIIAMPDVRERLIAIGMEPSPSSSAQLEAEIRTEVARWGLVIQRAGIDRE